MVPMNKLARFADARNTAEGKFIAILLSVLLVFSFLNVTMFTDRANATEEDPEVTLPIEDVEAEEEEEEESDDPTDEVVVENDESAEDAKIDGSEEPEGVDEDEVTVSESDSVTPVEEGEETETPKTSYPQKVTPREAALPVELADTQTSTGRFYLLRPGKDASDANYKDAWVYVGAEIIEGPSPEDTGKGKKLDMSYVTQYPANFPTIQGVDGEDYTYDVDETRPFTYHVEWTDCIVSDGWNVGDKEHDGGVLTYHVNGVAVLHYQQYRNIDFKVSTLGGAYTSVENWPKVIELNKSYVAPSVEAPKGQVFEGWYTDAACEIKATQEQLSVATVDVTFYGKLVREKHNLTYKSEGKTLSTAAQECEELFTVATAPEKEGYTFVGWRGDNGEIYEARAQATMPHADLTLTAQWEPNTVESYKVRYLEKGTGDSLADDVVVSASDGEIWKVGNTIPVDFNITQELITGYELVEVSSTSLTLSANAEENVVIVYYQKRTDISYTVKYVLKGSDKELADAKVVTDQVFGKTVTEDAESIQGYTAVESHKSLLLEKVEGNEIVFEYTANDKTPYKVKHYQETLDGDYVLVVQDTEKLTGVTGEEVKAEAKTYEGFTCVKTIAGTVASDTIKGDGSTELSLYYKRNVHKVSYQWEGKAPGLVGMPPQEMEYKYGETVPVAPKREVAGYAFEGWTPSPSVAIDVDKSQFTMGDEDVVFTGKWTPNSDTRYIVALYFQKADGTYSSSATDTKLVEENGETDSEVTIDPSAQEIPVGYEFDDKAAGNKLTGIITADGPLTLKVYYKRASYSVTYNYEGPIPTDAPKLYEKSNVRFGDTATVGVAPSAAGYDFEGWTSSPAVTVDPATSKFTMPAQDVVFTGKWVPRTDTKYVVQYYYEEQGAYPETPTKVSEPRFGTTGAVVSLMDKDSVPNLDYGDTRTFVYDKGASTEEAVLKGDGTTVLKVYFKQQIKLTFQPGEHGTFEETTRTYNYGDKVTAPEAKGAQGYIFAGWEPATKVTDPTEATVDNTYVAQWEASTDTKYTVKYFYMSGGKYSDDTNYSDTRFGTTGSLVELTEADKVTGESDYAYDAAATEEAEAMSGTIAGDGSTVLKVYFKQNFTVKFTTDWNKQFFTDDAVTEHPDLDYGVLVPSTPEIDPQKVYDWKLTGWEDVATGEVTPIESALPAVTKGATYKAQWAADEKTTYQVTYEATEGGRLAGVDNGKQLVNGPMPVIAKDPVTGATAGDPDPGYKFEGWYKVGSDGNVFLTSDVNLDHITAMKSVNDDPNTPNVFADTIFLAQFAPDWAGLAAKEINTTYDGTEKNLVVSGLVDGDVVTVDGEQVSFKADGTLMGTKYENVTDKTVEIKVKRGSFEITLDPVKVVIEPAELTIKKDLTQTFTGFAHVLDLTSEDIEGVADNQVVDLDVYNADKFARTVEGTSQWNALKKDALKIKKNTGEDTTSNYNITVDLKLTVTPLTIEPSGEGEEPKLTVTDPVDAVYDFAEHKFAPVVVNVVTTPRTELIAGEDYEVSYYRLNDEGERVATTDFVNVGTIIAVIEGKGNYTGTVEKTYEITPLPVVVTANDASKVYGQADPALTVAVADEAGAAKPNDGFDIQYAIEREAGEAVGSYTITPSGTAEQGNYRVTYASGTFRIAASDENTVTVANLVGTTGLTKVYDGEPTWVTPTASVAGSTFEYSLDGRTWTAEAPSFTNAGSYAVWVRANAANYETTPAVRATVTINPRPITITVNNASKVRGEADPVFTGSITAGTLVNANDLGAITFSRTNRTNQVGMYPGVLTANFVDNDNYTVTVELGNFTVRPAAAPAPADDDDDPTTPGTTVTPAGTTPTTVIDNDDTPLADEPTDTDFDGAVDDAGVEEAIGDDATPMAARGNIQDEDVPLGAFEDDHAACWVHWIMLLGLVATAVYGIAVVRRRLGMTSDIDDFENQIMGRNTVTETQPSTADGRQAL